MLIVLEGADGVGKTTIAKRLARILKAEIIHCTAETPNDGLYFASIIKMSESKNIIADRFMYGQFVYQDEHERNLSKAGLYSLERGIAEVGGKVIYVTCPPEVAEKRLKKRGEETSIPVRELMARFDKLMSESSLDIEVWRT